ncbi:uncharacterized protein TRIADDRAFT_58844 [Trichoplax adhaerens]|uniref:G-protein coupled receptors family 1 profile domain-containing protein n=1 Tax=Trichoplax adhaerens TaxID=10228 RepID=B3S3U0_TRIAD|nr:hypothetical protein TRIADDRAFT_58844 [Trichoplax adhaerens]EDV22524.1 hypothetical protein TRIADDRAFT_58844 [Trichoplax adhaerens]|eukprot:XP_002115068.1 hypothetical protein TRIADDRAFT_58844 [Trichoplax adhaerens]
MASNESQANSYELTLRTVYIITFIFVITVVVIGNFVICFTIATHRRLWNYTNIMLFNYGVATTVRVLTAGLLNFLSAWEMSNQWPFGLGLCQFSQSIGIVTVLVSAYSLVCMSYARNRIITYSLLPPPNLGHCFVSIAIIWCASFAFAAPYMAHIQVLYYNYTFNGALIEIPYCLQNWDRTAIAYYFLATSIVALIAPLICITYFNIRMALSLRPAKEIKNSRKKKSDHLKQQMKKMLVIIVVVFFITYFPYMIFLNLLNFNAIKTNSNSGMYLIRLVLGQATYTCSAFNVLICYRFNPHFRRAFRNFLCGLCESDAGRHLKSTISFSTSNNSQYERRRRKSRLNSSNGIKISSPDIKDINGSKITYV